MTINNRLRAFMAYKSLNQAAFARELNMLPQSLGNYLKDRDPDCNTLTLLFNRFRELNPQWLLLGEGEMLKKDYSLDDVLCSLNDPSAFYKSAYTVQPDWAIKKRIQEVLTRYNYDLPTVSELTHIPQKTLQSQIQGKGAVTIDLIRSLRIPFPEVSPLWYLTGQISPDYDEARWNAREAQLTELQKENIRLKEELEKLKEK